MRFAIYSRVSSRDKRQEIANQSNRLRELCAAQNWTIVMEYEDHDSGSKSDRPQFKAMMSDAAKRKFDGVLFWALDRFSREGPYETHVYLKRLDDAGVRFRSFTEPYLDTCGMFRDAVISILATIARQERLRIQERVRAGLDRARAHGTRSGKPVGRPRVVFRRDQVVELRNQDKSWRTIARECGVGVTTVRRAYKLLKAPKSSK
ncbi:MAG TPA: recombinase family protein [Bryobacteraceae bacterium]|nr:recombinase family protein [Bryobacteraceae bacterium]